MQKSVQKQWAIRGNGHLQLAEKCSIDFHDLTFAISIQGAHLYRFAYEFQKGLHVASAVKKGLSGHKLPS